MLMSVWDLDDSVKEKWGKGPWDEEPDNKDWSSKYGLPCCIRRSSLGTLCGYLGLDRDHPLFGRDYDSLVMIDCHGGLTFAEASKDGTHWVLGFDCAHSGDVCPVSVALEQEFKLKHDRSYTLGTYKDIEYVTAKCEALAELLHPRLKWLILDSKRECDG